MRLPFVLLSLAVFALLPGATSAPAADYFLSIGGGYSPTGNQVSLEKNVLLFQRLLAEQYPEGVSHDVYFADGDDPGRDLQVCDPAFEIPRVHRLLAGVFQQTRYLESQYRSHTIENVRGASSRENLERWFDEQGRQLKSGDRLFIYVTAHGGRATDKKSPHNTALYLWDSQRIQMQELAVWLDKIDPQVPVVLIMVQCYSGGFADVVFHEGDSAKGFTAANRCGFFATVHDRGAAGCTPDINEEDYQEYSSYFWAAIRGQTRTGQTIPPPDYDGNGAVSFAEAHGYVMLVSPTIDIPVKTSDAFLRQFSKLPDASEPLSLEGSYTLLLKEADPVEAVVLEGLSSELGLTGEERAQQARGLADRIGEEKKKLESQKKGAADELRRVAGEISKALQQRWPEFSNRWHPRLWQIVSEESEQLCETIESHPRYARFAELNRRVDTSSDEILDLDRRWVKTQRFLRVLENVAFAANLANVATPEVQERYQQLLAAEAGLFHAGSP